MTDFNWFLLATSFYGICASNGSPDMAVNLSNFGPCTSLYFVIFLRFVLKFKLKTTKPLVGEWKMFSSELPVYSVDITCFPLVGDSVLLHKLQVNLGVIPWQICLSKSSHVLNHGVVKRPTATIPIKVCRLLALLRPNNSR